MTFLIIATLSASVVYFAVAFIATMRDRLMSRFSNYSCMSNFSEPDVAVTDYGDIAETITETDIQVAVATDYVTKSIRELREYIRTNELQEVVRTKMGKTVSKCSKGELLAAIA